MFKKYVLKKDLPFAKAGVRVQSDNDMIPLDYGLQVYIKSENINQQYFEHSPVDFAGRRKIQFYVGNFDNLLADGWIEEAEVKKTDQKLEDLRADYEKNLKEVLTSFVDNWASPSLDTWQLCPKCNGRGVIIKSPYVQGDMNQWSSSSIICTCDVCNGSRIIKR